MGPILRTGPRASFPPGPALFEAIVFGSLWSKELQEFPPPKRKTGAHKFPKRSFPRPTLARRGNNSGRLSVAYLPPYEKWPPANGKKLNIVNTPISLPPLPRCVCVSRVDTVRGDDPDRTWVENTKHLFGCARFWFSSRSNFIVPCVVRRVCWGERREACGSRLTSGPGSVVDSPCCGLGGLCCWNFFLRGLLLRVCVLNLPPSFYFN